ncbi:protein FLOURY 1-like [Cornus florida]|uniref:protein FLOURY 1-like n=1 Tax=Cornus florida TaxID=4283 RepID=UPI00289B5B88|nr:protein FLOURY 1-like [Cornus florida]
MQILGNFCLLLIACSVHDFFKRFLENFLGFLLMEYAPILKLFNVLGLCLLLGFGFKVLKYGFHCKALFQFLCDFRGKSRDLRNGFSSENGKILCCKCGLLKFIKNSDTPLIEELEETKEIVHSNRDVKAKISLDENFDDDEQECSNDEDEVVDVMSLRKLVKMERGRANVAYSELVKERMAAATAAEEAMAMILRLQKEKSLIEMEANQYRRLTEEKQFHDQEVIESLRWIVLQHESERSLLEDQLRMYSQNFQLYMKGDEVDESHRDVDNSICYNIEDGLGDGLISSLDMGLSPL